MTDAGGMGVSGLMQSMAIYAGLRVALENQEDTVNLGAAFRAVNHTLCARSSRQLVACAAVLIDLTAGRLAYVNAGLPAPLLLVGPQRLVTLDKSVPMLGVDAGAAYEPTFVDLSSKFRVVLHTDGLTDALNATGEPFGEERLHEALLQPGAFGTPEQLLDKIVETHESHLGQAPNTDDALILTVAHGS
jgi:sigma-B regulation protein RsbU (phosphoserine phosphatase)